MLKKSVLLGVSAALLLTTLVAAIILIRPLRHSGIEAQAAADNLYLASHYAEAAQIYEQIVAQGSRNSTIYYNLGNSYYQLGDLGRALLNYEEAAALSPRDADIQENLALVTSQVGEIAPILEGGALARLTTQSRDWLSLNELALLALASWLLLGFFFLATSLFRPGRVKKVARTLTAVTILFMILIGAVFGGRLYADSQMPDWQSPNAGLAIGLDSMVAPDVELSTQ